ncbi:MAG: hypothetical protein AAGG07_10180 [Planctomycetota bacterium]
MPILPKRPGFRAPALLASGAIVSCCLSGVGCGGPTATVVTDPGPAYEGPAIDAEGVDGDWVLLMIAPTPGWNLTIDRVLDRPIIKQVFVTLERPDPTKVHAQVVVPVRNRTAIPSAHPLRVHARVAAFGDSGLDESALPYRVVGQFGP